MTYKCPKRANTSTPLTQGTQQAPSGWLFPTKALKSPKHKRFEGGEA